MPWVPPCSRCLLLFWSCNNSLLTSTLNSSCLPWSILVQACSVAAMYSVAGVSFGVITNFGPWAKSLSWALVSGVFDRLTPLTSDQERLFAHGPKFVITPKETPATEYIAATEQACTKIDQGKQDEFRVEVKRLLLQDQNNKRQCEQGGTQGIDT